MHLAPLIVIASGLFGAAAFAQESAGMRLEAAGFAMKEADTPQKMARLKSVPARKFIARNKDGRPYYIYADPDYCKCAYVGGEDALKKYRAAASAGVGFLPGYRDAADMTKPSGDDVAIDMIHDMASDNDPIPRRRHFPSGILSSGRRVGKGAQRRATRGLEPSRCGGGLRCAKPTLRDCHAPRRRGIQYAAALVVDGKVDDCWIARFRGR